MKVEIFSIVKNQENILPLYLEHYNKMFDSPIINIYNNKSTDASVKLCQDASCNVVNIRFKDVPEGGTPGEFYEEFASFNFRVLEYLNDRIYSTKADWILMCDPDELVQITTEDLEGEDADVIRFTGYQMIKKDEKTYDELKLGYRDGAYDKPILFKPNVVMNFGMGAHTASPVKPDNEPIKYNTKPYKLLHYKEAWMDQLDKLTASESAFNVKIEIIK